MINTTNNNENASPTEESVGDFGDFSGIHAKKEPPTITDAIVDQNGCRWFNVNQGKNNAIIKLTDLHGSGQNAVATLSNAGIVVVTTSSIRKLAEAAEEWVSYSKRLVADRPGWIGETYILGDGTAFSPSHTHTDVLNLVDPVSKFSSTGTLKEWLKTFTPLIAGQEAVMVALSFAFLPPLQDIVASQHIQNPIWDICGESTKGKTTIFIIFAGSIWGWAEGDTCFGESWNLTKGGVDLLIAQHHGTFLGLDEANLAGDTPEEREKLIAYAIHLIANGAPKVSKKMTLQKRPSSLTCVSTSNDSLTNFLKGSKASRDAIAARFVTIHVPKGRPYGIFTKLPKGFETSLAIVKAINAGIAEQHGTPIRRYIQKLVDARHQSPKKLQADIQGYCEIFYKAIEIDKNDGLVFRRAEKFALAYAANRLARRWGCLPDAKKVGNYLEAFKVLWSWTSPSMGQSKKPTPDDKIRAYIKVHRRSFPFASTPKRMSDEEFQNCKGFKNTSVDRRRELLLPPKQFKSFGFQAQEISDLKHQGVLIGEKGNAVRNDNKRSVRLNGPAKDKRDRVFVLVVDRHLLKLRNNEIRIVAG